MLRAVYRWPTTTQLHFGATGRASLAEDCDTLAMFIPDDLEAVPRLVYCRQLYFATDYQATESLIDLAHELNQKNQF